MTLRRIVMAFDVDDGDLARSPFPVERSKVAAFVEEARESGVELVLLKIDGQALFDAQ